MRRPLVVLLWVLVAAVALLAATVRSRLRPQHVHVERSIVIEAPPNQVFAQVADLRRWSRWMPWMADPRRVASYAGPPSGVGAVYTWTGGEPASAGSMPVTASTPGSEMQLELEIRQPVEATGTLRLHVFPEDDATSVLWVMNGRCHVPAQHVWSTSPTALEHAIGDAFERALVRLKTVAEAESAAAIPRAAAVSRVESTR